MNPREIYLVVSSFRLFVKNTLQKQSAFLKKFSCAAFCATLFLGSSGVVFPAEDINQLIKQGEEALLRGDYDQVLLAGKKILAEDPRNLRGYGFRLIYCMATGNEPEFRRIAEEAGRQGDPRISDIILNKMVAQILYLGGQPFSAHEKLIDYEAKWREVHDKSR
jgi:hypothetical protein